MKKSEVGDSYPVAKSEKLSFDAIHSQLGFLQGKVLTVVDASYPDGRQLEAVKGLIKNAFRDQKDWIARLCFKDFPIYSKSEMESQGVDIEEVAKEVNNQK